MSYCIHCGAKLEEGSKFCTNCGMEVGQDASQAVASDSSAPAQAQAEEKREVSDASARVEAPNGSPNRALVVTVAILAVVAVVVACLILFLPSLNGSGSSSGLGQTSQQQSSASDSSGNSSGAADVHESDPASHHEPTSSSSANGVSVTTVEGFRGDAGSGALTAYSASSVLPASEYGTYVASNLDDGALSTAWVEGASGSGSGQSVKMSSPSGEKMTVYEVELASGYAKSEDIYYKNARPKQVSVVSDTGKVVAQVTLSDSYGAIQSITFPATSTSSLTLRIDSVYEGNKYEDCAISEMRCY